MPIDHTTTKHTAVAAPTRRLRRREVESSRIEPLESRIAPALLLGINDGQTSIGTNGTLTYTIDYSNSGTAAVNGVVLKDTLPAGTTFDAAENPGWTLTGSVLQFNIGDLTGGAANHATLVLHTAAVAPAGLAAITNPVAIFHGGSNTADAQASDTTALNAAPDLQVTKTRQGEGTITTGSSITYAIDFSNIGDQNATGVKLTEHLPAGTTFDSAASSAGWTETTAGSGIYTLSIGALAGGGGTGSRVFAVKVKDVAANGLEQISNTVDIADDGANGTDPNTANNTKTLALDLSAAPDLDLTQTTTATNSAPGNTLTFNYTYHNTGNQDAVGVTITETLPAYATFDPAQNTGWTLDGTTLKLIVGNVLAAGTGTATLKLGVAAHVAAGVEQFSTTATIADNGTAGADPTPANNSSTVTLDLVATPNVGITKDDGRTAIHAGQDVHYTLTYSNTGNQGATGVNISDVVPAGMSFDAAANPGWVDDGNGHLTYAVGTVAGGATGTVTLVLKVNSELPQGTNSIANTATIADDGANGTDPDLTNNTFTDSDFIISAVDLTLHKTSVSNTVTPGGMITYHFDYTNAGDLGAAGVILTDSLPAGTTFSSIDNPGWIQVGNVLTYTLGNVDAGGSGSATLILGVASTAAAGFENITNTASIADDGSHGLDYTPADNASTATVSLNAAADLHLTKTSDGAAVSPTSAITYQFSWGNSGNQISNGVKISDVLPSGTTFNAAANPGWTLANGTLTYNIGTLAPGDSGTATLILAVAASAPAGLTNITNTATIGDDGTSGADANVADNSATAVNPLTAKVDLVVAVSPSVTTVNPFGQVNYTLTYSNAGNQTASNVVLEEKLPAGTTFNAGASTTGWTLVAGTTDTYHLTIASLAGGGTSSTAIFAVNVSGPVAAGIDKLQDTAKVSSDATESDSDSLNNTANATDVTVNAAPNLGVSQTASSITVSRGGLITYSITYANVGNQASTGAFLTETLPAGFTFVAGGSSTGWTQNSNGTYHYDIGNLGTGQSVTVTFQARAASNAAPGSHPLNKVEIADDAQNGTDPNLANNVSSLSVTVPGGSSNVSTGGNSGGGGGSGSASNDIMAIADDDAIKVYDAKTGALKMKFSPYGDDHLEKLRVTLGDVNGDGIADIITSAKDHRVRAFDGATGMRLAIGGQTAMKIFGNTDAGSADIAAADFNGDGIADLVVGEGKGGGLIKIYDGKTGAEMASFSPFGDSTKGIRVAVSDVNGDGIADILARQGGSEGSVHVYSGATIGSTKDPLRLFNFDA